METKNQESIFEPPPEKEERKKLKEPHNKF